MAKFSLKKIITVPARKILGQKRYNKLKNTVRRGRNYIRRNLLKVKSFFYCKTKLQPRVVFHSFVGKQYSDNSKAVSERLHEVAPEVEIVWFFLDVDKFKGVVPEYVKCVEATPKNLLYYYSTSKVWADNCTSEPMINNLYKSKKQTYIHFWHGDRGFKKCFFDLPGWKSKFLISKKGFCDYMTTGSVHAERVYTSMFRYKNPFLKVGCPRNDMLINEDANQRKEIRSKLGLDDETKLLIYAPTFRRRFKKKGMDISGIDLDNVIAQLEKTYGCKWVCGIRGHHEIGSLVREENNSKVIDLTSYPDMADLMLAGDMLITDYSSCAGDFALTHRPVILFIQDLEEYTTKDRTLLFDIDKSPYIYAETNEQLIDIIKNIKKVDIKKNCDDILEFYETYETGKATDEVVKIMLEALKK